MVAPLLQVVLVAAVVLHQLMELQELNQDKLTQVGVNGDIMAVLVEIVLGQAAVAAALPVMDILLQVTIMADLVVMEEHFQVKFLQHLVIMVFSVVAVVVAVMVIMVVTELVDLAAVDKVVVMKARALWM